MDFFLALLWIALIVLLALALPAWAKDKSKNLLVALFLSLFGILVPLAFFFLSVFMTPEAKSLCQNGPLDCFHTGKLALTPFVLWASAALYASEIYRVENRRRAWIVQGLIVGAIVSSVCAVFGWNTHAPDLGFEKSLLLLSVPFYTAIWYSVRTGQALRDQWPDSVNLTKAVSTSLPFWAYSILLSYKTYLALPDQPPPGCFVVTAASRGHPEIVGRALMVSHRGRVRLANQQLATFWAFEDLWRCVAPCTHAAFRRGYDVIGPIIARQISSPWLADALYIALKPAELFARFALSVGAVRQGLRNTKLISSI